MRLEYQRQRERSYVASRSVVSLVRGRPSLLEAGQERCRSHRWSEDTQRRIQVGHAPPAVSAGLEPVPPGRGRRSAGRSVVPSKRRVDPCSLSAPGGRLGKLVAARCARDRCQPTEGEAPCWAFVPRPSELQSISRESPG